MDGLPLSTNEAEVHTLPGFRGALSMMERPLIYTSVLSIKKRGAK